MCTCVVRQFSISGSVRHFAPSPCISESVSCIMLPDVNSEVFSQDKEFRYIITYQLSMFSRAVTSARRAVLGAPARHLVRFIVMFG